MKLTVSTGEVNVIPISDSLVALAREAVRKEFLSRGEPINPPTYNITVAGGGVQQVPHDETTLESDDDRAAWQAYQLALKRLTVEQDNRVMKVWLTGLDVSLPEDDKWIRRQKFLGVDIPQDEFERLHHYIITEVLKTPNDFFLVIDGVMKETYKGMVKEEDLDSMMNSFRDQAQVGFSLRVANTKR